MSTTPQDDAATTTAAPLPSFLPPSQPSRPRRFDPPASPPAPLEGDDLTPGPLEGDDPAGASPWVADVTPETLTGSSSPAFTERKALPRLDAASREVYAASIAKGAQVAAAVVDTRLGGDGSVLMHDREAADIAAPASRLAARFAPLPIPGGAGAATTAADVAELCAALVGYALAVVGRRRAAVVEASSLPLPSREDRALSLAPHPGDDDPEPPAGPALVAAMAPAGVPFYPGALSAVN